MVTFAILSVIAWALFGVLLFFLHSRDLEGNLQ